MTSNICFSLYIIAMVFFYGISIYFRLDTAKATTTSGPDLLVPFVSIGIWIGSLLILSSVAVLIGGLSLLWLGLAGSLVVTGIMLAAQQIVIRRFDPAKEARKMKRKPKRTFHDHLPY